MTREEKVQFVKDLTQKITDYGNFYVADTGGLTVEKVNALRALCFKAEIEMQVIKNSLIKKALNNISDEYQSLFPALKQTSAVFFIKENPNSPAKVLKQFRGKDTTPALKCAYVESSVFLGDASLDQLASLKSKGELLGEIIGLLQSPAKNVVSALQSGGGKLAGILKTLSEKGN
jgi:large subunit ribosomal protein L10